MATKELRLRRDDICAQCGVGVAAGDRARWDVTARTVTCLRCSDPPSLPTTPEPATRGKDEPAPLDGVADHGTAGASARREYERRLPSHEQQVEDRWGTGWIGRVAQRMSPPPQSTTAWAKGAAGEARLAEVFSGRLGEECTVLHDRGVPGFRANIDHIVVASSGVWIVDAKNYAGIVEHRDVGGWRTPDLRLYVGGRDRTKVVTSMRWQVDVVRPIVESVGLAGVGIHSVVCFTHAEWRLFARPFAIGGVLVVWPRRLAEVIDQPGSLSAADVQQISAALARSLPPA